MPEQAENRADPGYRLTVVAADALPASALERCIAIVLDGNAVNRPDAVRRWLPRAMSLAVVRQGDQIVGVGAIKPARRRYAEQVAKKSGHAFPVTMPELGYVARDRAHRGHGLAPRIVAALLECHPGPVWATTASEGMKAALAGAGFQAYGSEWDGDDGRLSLWIRA